MKQQVNSKPMMKKPMTTTEQDSEVIVEWKYMHPMLGLYIYKNLPEPVSLSDAYRRMAMHRNSVEDIDIQIQITEMTHSIFLTNIANEEEEQPDTEKFQAKQKKYMERISVLLNSKLQHKRRAAAYWYWLQCHDEQMDAEDAAQLAEVSNG